MGLGETNFPHSPPTRLLLFSKRLKHLEYSIIFHDKWDWSSLSMLIGCYAGYAQFSEGSVCELDGRSEKCAESGFVEGYPYVLDVVHMEGAQR